MFLACVRGLNGEAGATALWVKRLLKELEDLSSSRQHRWEKLGPVAYAQGWVDPTGAR